MVTWMSLCWAAPIEIQPGVVYQAGTQVGVAEIGVSLVVPPDWKGALADGGEAFLLGSDTVPGVVLVLAQPAARAEAIAAAGQPVQLDAWTQLVPAGPPVANASQIRVTYTIPQQPEMAGLGRVLLADHGMALAFVVAGPKAQLPAYASLLDRMAQSVKFAAPVAPTGGPWGDRLRGKRLLYIHNADGYAREWKLDLCADGTYSYSSWSSTPGTAALTVREEGSWTVAGDRLRLLGPTGEIEETSLREGGGGQVMYGSVLTQIEGAMRCP